MELRNAQNLARDLMRANGLDADGWSFGFNRAARCAGLCRYGTRTIFLSEHFARLNDEAEVRDTILHEIAHALVGGLAGHGFAWWSKAKALGCRAERCVSLDAVKMPEGTLRATCPACAKVFTRFRRPRVARYCRCIRYRQSEFGPLIWSR